MWSLPLARGELDKLERETFRSQTRCKARGQPGQPFSHKTGHGYVKAHRGFYHVHDAIFVKRNNFNLLLHETFGGGFSPTAVLKLVRRLARKVARGSVDRTRPTRPSTRSLLCHTMQSASLSLCCARREPRHSLPPGNPVCTSRARVNLA